MLDWLIIGGGIHGTYLSHVLQRRGVAPERLRVLDPHAQPLARWRACTANTGMRFLRSPGVHHLDRDAESLIKFCAAAPESDEAAWFAAPYHRPALALFDAHTDALIEQHGLARLRIVGEATGLQPCRGGWRVETSRGGIEARRVILAIGMSEQPARPDWAQPLYAPGAALHHIFDPAFQRDSLPAWTAVVVVGGGITAVQTALALANRAPGTVTWLARHGLREHQFDSDPCWMGPKCLAGFAQEPDPVRRRAIIQQARHRGSVPPDVARSLQAALDCGHLTQRIATVERATLTADGAITLTLAAGAGSITAERVVLATGFDQQRPGGAWLAQAIDAYGLPCAPCGYPLVDATLCWRAGLYVTGPLAELELGPAARNIIGARHAGARLVEVGKGEM